MKAGMNTRDDLDWRACCRDPYNQKKRKHPIPAHVREVYETIGGWFLKKSLIEMTFAEAQAEADYMNRMKAQGESRGLAASFPLIGEVDDGSSTTLLNGRTFKH